MAFASATSAPVTRREGLPAGVKNRKLATAAVMAGLVVTAFEGSVVTPAMPTIVRELGGLELFPWVFTAFLLASTISVPLAGKLADRAGRRPVFVGGMVLFLAGSVLAGTARSMEWLIAFRVVQGLGVGAVAPVGTTISADLYTLEERAKIHGLFTASWGLANVAGPPLGGFIVTHASWRWVFLVNVPVGALAVALLAASYADPKREKRSRFEPFGSALAALGIGGGLLAADRTLEGQPFARAGLVLFSIATLALFFGRERRSKDPVIPRETLADPLVAAGAVGSLFTGAIIYAPTAYVPFWITHSAGGDAMAAGSVLIPMLVGWAAGSTLGVRILVRRGIRFTASLGLALATVAAVLLALVTRGTLPLGFVHLALGLLGLGLGPAANAFLLGSQARVPWESRGAVTSVVHTARALGGSVAVALLGAVGAADESAARFAVFAVVVAVGFVVTVWLVPPQTQRLG